MNDSLLKSDIFFLVTTISVIILTLGLSVLLYYAIRVFKNLSALSKKAQEEGEKILEDVKFIRESTEMTGNSLVAKVVSIASFLLKKTKVNKKKL